MANSTTDQMRVTAINHLVEELETEIARELSNPALFETKDSEAFSQAVKGVANWVAFRASRLDSYLSGLDFAAYTDVMAEAGAVVVSSLLRQAARNTLAYTQEHRVHPAAVLDSALGPKDGVSDEMRGQMIGAYAGTKRVLEMSSARVQQKSFKPLYDLLDKLQTRLAKERLERFLKHAQAFNASIGSVVIAILIFERINKAIHDELEAPQRSAKRTQNKKNGDPLFYNTIIIYEASRVMSEYTETMTIEGRKDIETMRDEISVELKMEEEDDQQLLEKLERPGVDEAVKTHVSGQAALRHQAREETQQRWEDFIRSVREREATLEGFKGKSVNFEILRGNIRQQLDALTMAYMTGVIKGNLETLDDLTRILEELNLRPITQEDVIGLLKLDLPEKTETPDQHRADPSGPGMPDETSPD